MRWIETFKLSGRVSRVHVNEKHSGGGGIPMQWWSAGLRERTTLVYPFRERAPKCPRSTDAALYGRYQKSNMVDTERERGTGQRNGAHRPILPNATNSPLGEKIPVRLSFFPDGSGTPIPVSKLVKDLRVQTDNVFSHSALKPQMRQDD